MNRGNAAMEFALCLPFIVLGLVGAADFSLWVERHHTVSRAVQDGARSGAYILAPSETAESDIESLAVATVAQALVLQGITVSTVTADWYDGIDARKYLRVSAQVPALELLPNGPFRDPISRTFVVMTRTQ